MNKTDIEYQKIVDREAQKLIELDLKELLDFPDYGIISSSIGEKEIDIGFWHHVFSEKEHHIYFKTHRYLFLFFYRNYISGIVFGIDSLPRLMTEKEYGQYD